MGPTDNLVRRFSDSEFLNTEVTFVNDDELKSLFKSRAVEREESYSPKLTPINSKLYYILALAVFFVIIFGVLFNIGYHNWSITTSLFYTTQLFLGELYDVPHVADSVSMYVNIILYMCGEFILAGAVGIFATVLVEKARMVERARFRTMMASTDMYTLEDEKDPRGFLATFCENALETLKYLRRSIFWRRNKFIYLFSFFNVIWWAIGVMFGVFYERWDVNRSVLFAVGGE